MNWAWHATVNELELFMSFGEALRLTGAITTTTLCEEYRKK
jgi:hypothetical protein